MEKTRFEKISLIVEKIYIVFFVLMALLQLFNFFVLSRYVDGFGAVFVGLYLVLVPLVIGILLSVLAAILSTIAVIRKYSSKTHLVTSILSIMYMIIFLILALNA